MTFKLDEKHAMVVLSGGMDSTICLGYALNYYERVDCVTFDYGQTHDIELEAARNVVSFMSRKTGRKINHEIVRLGKGTFAGTSPLTAPDEPLAQYSSYSEMVEAVGDRVEATFVPMRNAVFLTLAASRALVAGAPTLITGVSEMDSANYPDCRSSFIKSMESTINEAAGLDFSSKCSFLIETPLIDKSKAESIIFATTLPFTYEALKLTHTAYDGKYPPTGKDHASLLRAEGFKEANLPDPLVLRAWKEGLMELPDTDNYEGAPYHWQEFEQSIGFNF